MGRAMTEPPLIMAPGALHVSPCSRPRVKSEGTFIRGQIENGHDSTTTDLGPGNAACLLMFASPGNDEGAFVRDLGPGRGA